MSFWKKNTSSPKPNAPTIRVEKIAIKTPPSAVPVASSRSKSRIGSASSQDSKKPSAQTRSRPIRETDTTKLSSKRQSSSRKRSPAYQRVESDTSDEDDDDDASSLYKRQRLLSCEVNDPSRNLRSQQQPSQINSTRLVHAADVASLKLGFKPAFPRTTSDDVSVRLQFPGGPVQERYELVYRNDFFDPTEEILGVVKDFTNYFFESETNELLVDADTGIIRRLERARNLRNFEGFTKALDDYNAVVNSLRESGKISAILDEKHGLSESIVIRIMTQTYDRAVSPRVDLLRRYENGTNEIYGELKSNLVYAILAETRITSSQVFVDLGSGVGNVVLQAALQVGCESWGCEIMENACTLADAQKAEFEARCRLWGIEPGLARLEHGDFMTNTDIRGALQRADVVLVNNEVFTPELNVSLVNLFLDLKEGCKIVSLKSFVPHNRKISNYNNNDPSNILEVEKRSYSTKSVSWKDEGGDYYIATKDSKRLQRYAAH